MIIRIGIFEKKNLLKYKILRNLLDLDNFIDESSISKK